MKYIIRMVISMLLLLAATAAQAVPISVNTNGFTQEWYTNSLATGLYSPYYNGDKVIDLVPGRYYFGIVHPGAGGQGHLIEVLADGTINDLANDGALTLSPGVISFNTIDVTIDPNAYEGRWQLGHSGWKKPMGTVRVVKGQHYGLSLGWPMGTGFTIDAAGIITVDDPVSASVNGNTITLNTIPVHFDPVNYLGQYAIHYGTRWISGKNTLMLVPNQHYYFGIAGMDAIWFDLDAQGNVDLSFTKGPDGPNPPQYWTSKISDKSIMALPSTGARIDTIRFKNTQASIDVGSYVGLVAIHRILVGNRGRISGKQNLTLVPNLRNGIYVNAWGHFFFRVDALGNLSVENGISATVNYSQQTGLYSDMVLNSHQVKIDPGTYTGNWDMWEGSGLGIVQTTGPKTITMVDGVDYPIRTSSAPWGAAQTTVSKTWFQVTPTCQITPSGTVAVGAETFTVSCVKPNTPPVANAGAAQVVEQTSPAGAMVTLDGSGSSDADGDPLTYTWSGPFGSATGVAPTVQFPAGTYNANLIVNDGTVDSAPSSVIITVQDTTAPVVTAPAAVTLEATGAATAAVIGTATATDAVGVVSISSDAPATFPLGVTTVTWSARDAAGNTGTATQTVSVVDTTAPVITAPANFTVEATGVLNTVAIGTATAIDAFAVTITNNAPASFPVGVTPVIWTATDANGNVSTATQTITVNDTTAPVVTAPLGITVLAAGAAGTPATDPAIAAFLAAATATDTVGIAGPITHNAPLTFPVGVTTVTFSATDAAGNTGTAIATVTVTTPNPALLTPAQIAALTPAQLAMLTPAQIAAIGGQLTAVQQAALSPAQQRALQQAAKAAGRDKKEDDNEADSEDEGDGDGEKDRKKSDEESDEGDDN